MTGHSIPSAVNGWPVVALAVLPDLPGYLPHRTVVVCRADDGSHVLWTVAWNAAYQGGQWTVTGSGRYDLTLVRALDVMVTRAKEAL